MNMTTSPGIIQQRWAAASASPSIPQWRSLAVWVENFADLCAAESETRHLVPELRELADEAWRNCRALMPMEAAA